MNEVQQIENGAVQHEAMEPVQDNELPSTDSIEERQKQIRDEFATNPISSFNSFAYKVAEIAGYSQDCRLAHAAYKYLKILYAEPYVRHYERVGMHEILALCFHSHAGGNAHTKCCDECGAPFFSGSTGATWFMYSEPYSRHIIDEVATEPIKTWRQFSYSLAMLSICTGEWCCVGAANEYLERLMCQLWLTGEERDGAGSSLWHLRDPYPIDLNEAANHAASSSKVKRSCITSKPQHNADMEDKW